MAGITVESKARPQAAKLEPTLARLQLSTRDAPAPIALFDRQRRFLGASPAMELVTDIRSADHIGRRAQQIFPTMSEELVAFHHRAAAGEEFRGTERLYVGSDGKERWLCCEYKPVAGPDGRHVGYFLCASDVTTLMHARADAQAYAERLKLALGAARAGVSEFDFARKTQWFSPEFQDIVGAEVDFRRFAREPWYMAHPDDRALIDRTVASWTGARHEPLDFRIVLPSGEVRWVQAHAEQQLAPDGRRLKVVGLVLDIDARKRQELALAEAERTAQAAAEAKSQFLANMSHEIRTPMNGVLGVLHLLGREQLSEEGRQLLEEARNCGRMLQQLLDDVIDFSRIEAGRLELSPEPMDAPEVLKSVIGLLKPNAVAKGLELRVRSDVDSAWILADPVRVRQALFNLVGNAVKFTSRGHVEVSMAVRDDGGRRRLRFEVEDTGIGIPKAAQASLFSRFQQADGSTSRRFGGSGLGLAITRRLAQMMDGEVGFRSREGRGSTFWLEILAERAEAPRPSAAVATAPAVRDMSVLLVEDNPTNRLVARKMLEALGANVTEAEHGGVGVEAARRGRFELILMDIQMPIMDGVEATQRIRALRGARGRTPIIGLTANVMSHQRDAYRSAGMNGVVAKPISPSALVAEIARVMAESGPQARTAA